jgi:nucleoside phosphorylase
MRRGIAYSIGKAGQASATSATQAIITQFRPALCIMSGFCGGFASKTKTGDVIFAESVVDWDSGKWLGTGEEAKFVPRPEPINIRDTKVHRAVRDMIQVQMSRHIDVLARVAHFSQNRISQISFQLGPMASGSAVVTDPIIINRIQDLNENILGVDMEAFGFCYAASTTPVIKPEFLVVKAVADFCDAHKAEKDQAACSYLSANVVQELISRRWSFA